MTVTVQIPYNSYTYSGGTSFAFGFQVLTSADLVVAVNSVVKTLGLDYTISGVGSASGGTVTYITTLTSGDIVEVYRQTALARSSDYPTGGDFPASSVNADFNRLWMAVQEVVSGSQTSKSSVRAPTGGQLSALPNAATRADRLLAFDASTGDVEVTSFTASQVASVLSAVLIGAATTAAAVSYLATGIGAASMLLQDKLRLDSVYPEEYGAIGDGSSHPLSSYFGSLAAAQAKYGTAAVALTDEIDGVVIQYLINNLIPTQLRPTTYLTSRGLQNKTGADVVGKKRYSGSASVSQTVGSTWIRYVGAGGSNSYVLLNSTQAVGVEPTDPNTRDLQNVRFRDIGLDGGDLAWYGVIDIRAWQGNDFDNLTIANCRVCHNVVNSSWVTGPRGRIIRMGRGAGAWLGKNVWSFAASTTVDEFTGQDWFVYFMGCNSSGVPYNTFSDTGGTYPTSANADATCGIGIYGARALKLANAQVAQCDGPGIYVAPSLKGPIHIDGGYVETNSRSSGASKAWATWTTTLIDSWQVTYEKVYFGGSSPAHRITGTQVSRIEQGPKFVDCPIMGTVVADATYTNWNMIGCDQTVTIVGGYPGTPFLSMGGFQTEPGGPVMRYREGTWSPTLGGSTANGTGWAYSVNVGGYTRVGRMVHVTGIVSVSTKGTGTTGSIRITNLPYTVSASNNYNSGASISKVSGLTTSVVSLTGAAVLGGTAMDLYMRTAAAAGETTLALADLSNTTSFAFSMTYATSDA